MGRKREKPETRLARIIVPTPSQMKHKLSGIERHLGRKIDPWSRGLFFTQLWTAHKLEWHWYDQTWFFRGTREWWLLYEPFFWRSGPEFMEFERRFIKEATAGKGRMSQEEFVRRARAFKSNLQLGAIQGPLIAAVGGGSGAAAVIANALSKVNDINDWMDRYKCVTRSDGYEEACAAMLGGAVTSKATQAISR